VGRIRPNYDLRSAQKYDIPSHLIDVFLLGNIFSQCLLGTTPFIIDENVDRISELIISRKKHIPDILVSHRLSKPCTDLLHRIFCHTPNTKDLQKLPFFKHLDFQKLHQLEPPFVPQADC